TICWLLNLSDALSPVILTVLCFPPAPPPDEIMQQESSPLCAIDITPDLRKKFAFLLGGRGQNGSPIIVFPEFSAFGEIQEREFHNVLTYLTNVPSLSAAGVGFILVIDRRQDRWAAVKGTLLRIAVSNHAWVFLASYTCPLSLSLSLSLSLLSPLSRTALLGQR
uniref:Mcf.2 cell line derived transforming sequence-like b n=1 Tax=Salmo trutta TaxID=8032 RepID=A0A673WJX9_SALTR